MKYCWDEIEYLDYNRITKRLYKNYYSKKKNYRIYQIEKECPYCGNMFIAIENNPQITCSKECKKLYLKEKWQNKHRKKDGKYLCLICNEYKEPNHFSKNLNSKYRDNKSIYCKKCVYEVYQSGVRYNNNATKKEIRGNIKNY